jgi:hypothetical protein
MKVIDFFKFRDVVSFSLAIFIGMTFEWYIHKSTYIHEMDYQGLIEKTYHAFVNKKNGTVHHLYADSEYLFGVYQDDVVENNLVLDTGKTYLVEYVAPVGISWLWGPRLKRVNVICGNR